MCMLFTTPCMMQVASPQVRLEFCIWPCNRLEHRFQLHIIYPRGISVRIFQLVKMVYWLALQIYSSHIYIIPLVISIGNNFKILLSLRNGKIPKFNFSMRLIVCTVICIQGDSVEPMSHSLS